VRLLAVHTMGHDTGLCLFDDGRLVFAVETERLTRVRHDHQVEAALEHLWAVSGMTREDIDFLVFSTNVRKGLALIEDHDCLHARLEQGELQAESHSAMLGRRLPCLLVAHEASHAVLASHYGDAEPTFVLVNEGHGTFSRNSAFVCGPRAIRLVDHDALPWYGTGFGWTLLGYLLGFGRSPSAAGTAMALGGFGAVSTKLRDLLLRVERRVHLAPRSEQEVALRPLMDWVSEHPAFSDRAHLMRTFQELFTEEVSRYCAEQRRAHGCTPIALSGGCALNLHANSAIRRDLWPRLAIPPNCNDSGQPLGAAVFALRMLFGIEPERYTPYRCGVAIDGAAAREVVRDAGLECAPLDVGHVAGALERGDVVALSQGAAELGPRALGHRSLLASAARTGMRRRLSEQIKGRQWFRPLGCVMRIERFEQTFAGQPPSPYMLFNYEVPDHLLPEATHVDGTSRIQTIEHGSNPVLWDILKEYEARTGEIGLINTSLNGPGRPIAQSVEDVLTDFLDRDVDLFIFDDVTARRSARAWASATR
jgi:carbamoyltransferase